MEFKAKCMFLGRDTGKTKDGLEYKRLKFLDKLSNDTFVLYCQEFGKFEKTVPYSDVEVLFNLYKDSKGLYRLSLGGEDNA